MNFARIPKIKIQKSIFITFNNNINSLFLTSNPVITSFSYFSTIRNYNIQTLISSQEKKQSLKLVRHYYNDTFKMPVKETDSEIIVTHPNDESTSLKVLIHGANVLSWKIKGKEQLFLSEKAILDGSKAVRGGIPLVFPVFGKPDGTTLPQHGFARLSKWEFLGQTSTSPVGIQFGLGPENVPDELRKAWNYNFTLIYTIFLGEKDISTSISVENNDQTEFKFNFLFHTYFRIPDVSNLSVTGLAGTRVADKVLKSDYVEQVNNITISEEVDRVYENVESNVYINNDGKPLFEITRKNLNDVVVWNPWENVSKNLSDFAPADGYKNLVCVEAGDVSAWKTLLPGTKYEASQTIIGYGF